MAPVALYRLMDVETRYKLNRAVPPHHMYTAIRRSCQHHKYLIVDARCAMLLILEQALSNSVTTPSKAQSLSRFMINAGDSRLKRSALQCIYGGMALIKNMRYKASASTTPAEDASADEAAGGGGGGGSGGSPDMMAGSGDEESVAAAASEGGSKAPDLEAVKAAIQNAFYEESKLKKFVAWQDALGAWCARRSGASHATAGGGWSNDVAAASSSTQHNFLWTPQEDLAPLSNAHKETLENDFNAAEDAGGGVGFGGSPDMMTAAMDTAGGGGGGSEGSSDATETEGIPPISPRFLWIPQEELESLSDADQEALENYFRANPAHTLVVDLVGLTRESARAEDECLGKVKMPLKPLPKTLRHITFTNARRDIVGLRDMFNQQPYIETIQLRGFEKVERITFLSSHYTALKTLSFGFLPKFQFVYGPDFAPSLRSLDLRALYTADTIGGFEKLKALTELRFPHESYAVRIYAFHLLPATEVDLRGFKYLHKASTLFSADGRLIPRPIKKLSHMFQGCKNLAQVKWMPGLSKLILYPDSFKGSPVLETMDAETKALIEQAFKSGRVAAVIRHR